MEKVKKKKNSKKPVKEKKKFDIKWILFISILSFFISMFFSFIGETVIPDALIFFSIMLVFIFVFLGILFDIIGLSVTVADVKIFNSMATKKIKGSKLAVRFIKNASKVSSFCNDVIGDICGIISGSTGISIALVISDRFDFPVLLVTLLITAIIAAMTIGGKAIGKSIAINNCNSILYGFVRVISVFYKE